MGLCKFAQHQTTLFSNSGDITAENLSLFPVSSRGTNETSIGEKDEKKKTKDRQSDEEEGPSSSLAA